MVDWYAIAAVLIPVALGAVKGYTWYRKLRVYDVIARAKFHKFRKLVDDADEAILAAEADVGRAVSKEFLEATYAKLWADILALAE